MVETADLARAKRTEVLGLVAGTFARREARAQAGKYVDGLLADLPRTCHSSTGEDPAQRPHTPHSGWRTRGGNLGANVSIVCTNCQEQRNTAMSPASAVPLISLTAAAGILIWARSIRVMRRRGCWSPGRPSNGSR